MTSRVRNRNGRRGIIRGLIVSGIVVIIGAAAARHSTANIVSDWAPQVALRFAPEHPVALAEQADRELRLGRTEVAVRLARGSIRATALSGRGFQVLAQLHSAAGDGEAASRTYEYTGRLTRRETPAQIWIFNQELARGNVESAFLRLDGAMRVSRRSREALYPILSGAVAINDLTPAITRMFANDPIWLRGFLGYSIGNGASLPNLSKILGSLPENSVARSPEVQSALLRAMVANGNYSEARHFIQRVAPADTPGPVRDPSFNSQSKYPPFDWEYVSEARLNATPDDVAGSGLHYTAETGEGGLVARQLIALSQGKYRLSSHGRRLSSNSDGGVLWRLRCAANPQVELARLSLLDSRPDETRTANVTFVVPDNCESQWLELVVRAAFAPGGLEGVVDRVQVETVPTG